MDVPSVNVQIEDYFPPGFQSSNVHLDSSLNTQIHTPGLNVSGHIEAPHVGVSIGTPTVYVQQPPPQQITVVQGNPQTIQMQIIPTADAVCGQAIPILDPTMGLVVLILNIFFCGLGTMVVGCIGKDVNAVTWIVIGLVQLFTALCFVGWLLSILTGLKVYLRATQPRVATLL